MAGKKRVRDLGAEQAAVARPARKMFGAEAMAIVVEALRRGETVTAAAREAGFSRDTVHEWQRKAPHFGAACQAALDERRPRLVPAEGGHGPWRVRRPKHNAFGRARKEVFLEHFSATCDVGESADAAGVCVTTVYNHRRTDPVFADGWQEALQQGYARIEADALAQRIAALERLKVRLGKEMPARDHEVQAEFDRVMQLLREHKRGLAAARPKEGRPPTRWSFAEAMEALEKRLKVFGIRIEEEGEAQEDDNDDA
jgi:hypothetical protein